MRRTSLLVLGFVATGFRSPAGESEPVSAAGSRATAPAVRNSMVERIDHSLEAHWRALELEPVPAADDLTFVRRVYLDLLGRIPGAPEARAFLADSGRNKRSRLIARLVGESPEFPLYFARVLDRIVQGKHSGDRGFVEYLGRSLRDRKTWDRIFREILVGPWDSDDTRAARLFISKRAKSVDEMATDTARVFFGVDISCAKCHDHPLVDDWKQDHYYGMASFFGRTQLKKKGKDQLIFEKEGGEISYVTKSGEKREARPMFLSGQRLVNSDASSKRGEAEKTNGQAKDEETEARTASRRALLVDVALEDERFFSRAIVNYLWAYFIGRGLVNPLDQLHSRNRPDVEGLLDELAGDFADGGYRLSDLVEGIVSSRIYSLSSVPPDGERPARRAFAFAPLRPLTPHQYAVSVVLATGEPWKDSASTNVGDLAKRRIELESRAGGLSSSGMLDAPGVRFQSSTREALYLSNHQDLQRRVGAGGENLTMRLSKIAETQEIIDRAFWAVLSRPPHDDETEKLGAWLSSKPDARAQACEELVWALVTSAEFRFNH